MFTLTTMSVKEGAKPTTSASGAANSWLMWYRAAMLASVRVISSAVRPVPCQ